ncbi:MAG: hypothetical protein KA125_08330, partial [Chromatiaceae bacterium]|nr:hypothetical protein [Chromatiaceae bacterium]
MTKPEPAIGDGSFPSSAAPYPPTGRPRLAPESRGSAQRSRAWRPVQGLSALVNGNSTTLPRTLAMPLFFALFLTTLTLLLAGCAVPPRSTD